MPYGIYDYQDKIENMEALLQNIVVLEDELDQKIDDIEEATNRSLDEARERLQKEGASSNMAQSLSRLEQQGRTLVKDATGVIRYFEQFYKVQYVPQNIDYVSNVYYPSPYQYIDYMRSLSNGISNEVMQLTNRYGQGVLGRLMRAYNPNAVQGIFQKYEALLQIGNILHQRLQFFYDKKVSEEAQVLEDIKREADKKVDEVSDAADHIIGQREKKIEEILNQSISNEYIYDVERKCQSPDRLDIPVGVYNFYVNDLNKNSKAYQLILQRFSKRISDGYVWVNVGFELSEQHSFVFNYVDAKMTAVAISENMILQQLTKIEPDLIKLTVCSCRGMLEGLENLTTLCKNFPEMANGVFTRSEEVKDSILTHVDWMNDVLQNKLSGYKSVDEFNRRNIKKIPYKILFILDYQFDFFRDELKALIDQGYKAGIQVILLTNVPLEVVMEEKQYAGILKSKVAFHETLNQSIWRNICVQRLDLIPQMHTIDFNEMYNNFAVSYMNAIKKVVRFDDLIDTDQKYGKTTKQKLSIPIGINENGNIQCIEMGDSVANGTSHYGIIVGPTGSGKSSLLHTIITSSIVNYSPEEVELYLLDFKQGNEFKVYENKKIPHIKCLGLDAMQEFGDSVLQALWEELERRNRLFAEASQAGVEIKDITAYRNVGYQLPRILVIMDEFQVLFDTSRNKNVAYRAAAKMSDFVSRARVYGIHFLLATQTLHKIYETSSLSKGTLEEMHIRIGLQCQENELSRLMGDDNVKKCLQKGTKKRGSGIYLENDIVSEPVAMQVAYLETAKQKQILAEIEQDFAQYQSNEQDISYVFRGDMSPVLKEQDLETFAHEDMGFVIGEPVGLGKPIAIKISKKRKADVLIVGENQEMLSHVTQIWMRQVLKSIRNTNHKRLYVFDGAMMIDEPSVMDSCIYEENASRIVLVDNIFMVLKTIDVLYAEYVERRKRIMHSAKTSADSENIYVVISNYQWIEPLVRIMEHQDISEFEEMNQMENEEVLEGNVNPDDPFVVVNSMMAELKQDLNAMNKNAIGATKQISYYKKIKDMLSSGYFCGVHFLFTCQDAALMKKLGQSELAVFRNRVLFKASSKDSYAIIDTSISTESLGENMAIYSDGVNEPQLFRPYLWLDEKEV